MSRVFFCELSENAPPARVKKIPAANAAGMKQSNVELKEQLLFRFELASVAFLIALVQR